MTTLPAPRAISTAAARSASASSYTLAPYARVLSLWTPVDATGAESANLRNRAPWTGPGPAIAQDGA